MEDDTSIRNLITTTLKTNDYRYVVAMNGKMALMEAHLIDRYCSFGFGATGYGRNRSDK